MARSQHSPDRDSCRRSHLINRLRNGVRAVEEENCDLLIELLSDAKLGMGDWGYSVRKPDKAKLTQLRNEGYSFHPDAQIGAEVGSFGVWN